MKPKVSELIQKIEEAKGNISAIARAYGKTRSTIQYWIDSSETAKQAVKDARHLVVDTAESVLFKKVVEQELTAVFYVLNNSPEARERGWGVKQTDGAKGTIDDPVHIKHDYDFSQLNDDELDTQLDAFYRGVIAERKRAHVSAHDGAPESEAASIESAHTDSKGGR